MGKNAYSCFHFSETKTCAIQRLSPYLRQDLCLTTGSLLVVKGRGTSSRDHVDLDWKECIVMTSYGSFFKVHVLFTRFPPIDGSR